MAARGNKDVSGLRSALPAPPSAAIDPILDAAARCFVRFGVGRTSLQDVAREAGVDRTTVYRQVGNLNEITRLLGLRDLHQFLGRLAGWAAGNGGTDLVVELVVATVEEARAHPVLAKVLADERGLLAGALASDTNPWIEQMASFVAPLLKAGMKAGVLARRDPMVVAQWLTRISLSLILDHPGGDLRAFVGEMVVPALSPPS